MKNTFKFWNTVTFWYTISNSFNHFWALKIVLINIAMILMIPVRMAVLGVLNIKLRSNKGYGVIIYFHDLADKILSYESN